VRVRGEGIDEGARERERGRERERERERERRNLFGPRDFAVEPFMQHTQHNTTQQTNSILINPSFLFLCLKINFHSLFIADKFGSFLHQFMLTHSCFFIAFSLFFFSLLFHLQFHSLFTLIRGFTIPIKASSFTLLHSKIIHIFTLSMFYFLFIYSNY